MISQNLTVLSSSSSTLSTRDKADGAFEEVHGTLEFSKTKITLIIKILKVFAEAAVLLKKIRYQEELSER